jgi:hypothetical protein
MAERGKGMNEQLWAKALDHLVAPKDRIELEDLYALLEEVAMDAYLRGYNVGHDVALGVDDQPDVDSDWISDDEPEFYEGDSGDETTHDIEKFYNDYAGYWAGDKTYIEPLPPMQEQRAAVRRQATVEDWTARIAEMNRQHNACAEENDRNLFS